MLSGVTAALLARGLGPFAAACAAVHAHQRAGRVAAAGIGLAESVIASDVIEALPVGARAGRLTADARPSRAVAAVDLGAVERNCARLARELDGGAELCAVVKADGYGHGAVECARAALAGGRDLAGGRRGPGGAPSFARSCRRTCRS